MLSAFVNLAVFGLIGWYVLACVLFPLKAHRACRGRGWHAGFGGRRPCFRCQGTGHVTRRGRRLFNALMRLRDRNRKS